MEKERKSSGLALIPFLVFIIIYMGAGIILNSKGVEMAFYQFPAVVAMFIAVLVAFAANDSYYEIIGVPDVLQPAKVGIHRILARQQLMLLIQFFPFLNIFLPFLFGLCILLLLH